MKKICVFLVLISAFASTVMAGDSQVLASYDDEATCQAFADMHNRLQTFAGRRQFCVHNTETGKWDLHELLRARGL